MFVTDIHLKLRRNREWEIGRFLALFRLLSNTNSDTIILGGDIFDLSKPSLEEISVFYDGIKLLTEAKKDVYVISGNHENLSDTKTVFDYLPQIGFTYLPKKVFNSTNHSLYFYSHIHCKEIQEVKEELVTNKTSILFSHFRSNYGTFIKGEIDVKEVSELFDLVFVGDIHHHYSPFSNVHYPSSPYSIHYEPLRDYGIFHITLDKEVTFSHELVYLPSKVLLKVTPEEVEAGLSLNPEHLYKVVVTGSPDTKISATLGKNPQVDVFDYAPELQENTEEFEQLVDDLSSHLEEDVLTTIFSLLKANNCDLDNDLEQYLRKVVQNA